MKYYNARGPEDRPNGEAYYGTNGALHAANFIECLRSRKPPNGEIDLGHRATIVAHLGNIAFKTGRKLRWDAAKGDFQDAPEASRLLGRQARKPWDLI